MAAHSAKPRVWARMTSEVIKGFGRGSKELGIPTANLTDEAIGKLPADVDQGVYFGWAQLEGGSIHKSVMSVGWNPFFKNKTRSAEVHVMHKFSDNFYGKGMRVLILGRLRGEKDFDSVDALIAAIHEDIRQADEALSLPEYEAFKDDVLFVGNL
mmetsp:Transcript_134407/g.189986  ORF Transcript_134407/g.189986 Transcript_134407/m.189986 type:complete len:155 (-) Transcript_134407:97-561(-)